EVKNVNNPLVISILLALVLIVGIVVGYLVRKSIAEAKISSAENLAKQIVDEAHRNAESAKKEALLEAKEENHNLRQQAEDELRERRVETQKQEDRLIQKEENLDKKSVTLDKRELFLEQREQSLTEKQQQIEETESKVEASLAKQQSELERISGYTSDQAKQIILTREENELNQETAVMNKEAENRAKEKVEASLAKQQSELERISGYTSDQAKQIILTRVENELTQETAVMIKEAENRAKEEVDKKAKSILSLALQRFAADHVAETTVSVI